MRKGFVIVVLVLMTDLLGVSRQNTRPRRRLDVVKRVFGRVRERRAGEAITLADLYDLDALYDLYALAGERSHEVVRHFRDRWLTSFEPSEDDYVFPQYSDRPDAVYRSPWELIERVLAAPEQPHSLYWRNRRPGHELHAMLFFTTDGGLIAGLTVATEDPNRASTTLRQLAQSVDARYGYATWEEPPPETTSEFKAKARTAALQLLPR